MAEEVIKTVTHLKERAGFPIKKSLAVLGLPARTYHCWVSLEGKKPRPEGILPKGHWILPEEREKFWPSSANIRPWVGSGWRI